MHTWNITKRDKKIAQPEPPYIFMSYIYKKKKDCARGPCKNYYFVGTSSLVPKWMLPLLG